MEGYCVKCREKREMNNAEEAVTSRGMKMAKGQCGVCGTKMAKILGKA
jgi:hypothetical protein